VEAEEPAGPQGQPASARSTAADGDGMLRQHPPGRAVTAQGASGGRQGRGASPPSHSGFFNHTNKKMVFLNGSLIVSGNEF